LIPGWTDFVHPIHVSVTSIEYKEEEEQFQASFKIFTDDFETILSRTFGVTIKINDDPNPEEQIPYFDRYINKSFKLIINEDNQLVPEFRFKKINEEAVWLYYSYGCRIKPQSATIHNAIMMDMFDDQTNLLIMKFNDLEKGYQFKKGSRDITIKFDT
jgi:hypothetical protein